MSIAKKLQQFLDQQQGFDWDGNNCCHFVARWITEVEGRDPLVGLPAMRSREAAYRIIVSLGGWERTVSTALAREPVSSAWLQTGDAVLAQTDPGVTHLGIVNGRYMSCLSERGVEHINIPMGSVGWKVGRE